MDYGKEMLEHAHSACGLYIFEFSLRSRANLPRPIYLDGGGEKAPKPILLYSIASSHHERKP